MLEVLTVHVFLVHSGNLPTRQDLNMEADAHITVKPSESFYSQQVLSVSCCLFLFAPGGAAVAKSALFCAADRWKSSKQTAHQDPIQDHKEPGPGRHPLCANWQNRPSYGSEICVVQIILL